MLFPTSLVGSYPQPEWLIDRERLADRMPPRVRARDLWRVPDPFLEQAIDDATLLAIRAQERAGLDIITDGEIRRESYSNRFANALEGIDLENPGEVISRSGASVPAPRIVGRIARRKGVEIDAAKFLRANTDLPIKMTVPGPFTMSQLAQNDYYPGTADAAMDYADAVNAEVRELFAAGCDIVQIDEPYLQAQPEAARDYGLAALNRALEGVEGTTAVHLCFGYAAMVQAKPAGYSFLPELADSLAQQISIETAQPDLDCTVLETLPGKKIMVGCIDLSTEAIETPEEIAARVRKALAYIPPENAILAPDCGMKYLRRDVADAKLAAMTKAAALLRRDYASSPSGR